MAQSKTPNAQKSTKSSGKRSGGPTKPQAKTRSAPAAKRAPTATKRSSGNGSAPKSRRPSSSRSGRSSRSGSSSRSRSSSRGGSNGGPVASARDSVVDGAQSAGRAVGSAASDAGRAVGGAANAAKVPAVAGGAALAGLVGGMAIARGGRRRVLGVPIPGTRRPLVKINGRGSSTKRLMKTGRQVAELALEVRQARQQLATERRRSPIEVVLDGLTARRGRDMIK
jgi:hypothetical protein